MSQFIQVNIKIRKLGLCAVDVTNIELRGVVFARVMTENDMRND